MNANKDLSLSWNLNKFYAPNAKKLVECVAQSNDSSAISNLEKCLILVLSFYLFLTVHNFLHYTRQYTEAYELISLPKELVSKESEAPEKSSLPVTPEAKCHKSCDPAFLRRYSQMLGFKLKCDIPKQLIQAAGKWLGIQHTAKAGERGIDCSGFVRKVYKDVYNKDLNVSAAEMFARYAKPISRKHLKHGDLVFFIIQGNGISHVGIYLQDDKFIHTSYSEGVRVSSLKDKYYAERFYAAGRII